MKLIRCGECADVLSLDYNTKACSYGKAKGAYLPDGLHAWYSGEETTPLGFANSSFHNSIRNRPHKGWGDKFEAFVIPTICDTFEYRSE